MNNQGKIAEVLIDILHQTQLSRNEICCKLRALAIATGGASTYSGMVKLTSGGTASFDTTTPPVGTTQYTSVSVSVISLTTGTVTVTDSASNVTDISLPGYSTEWKSSGALTITVTGDAIAIVTFTAA